MGNIVLVGGQWGDEGKGKVVDLLASRFDIVARYAGGPNAGHTVRRGETEYALRHIPSGILTPGTTCIIGNGVVVDPVSILEEIRTLAESGVRMEGRLWISNRAHLILPAYRAWEAQREDSGVAGRIGTTRRGVGPAYTGKFARTGLRACDLYDREALPAKLAAAASFFRRDLGADSAAGETAQGEQRRLAEQLEECVAQASELKPYVTDTSALLCKRLEEGARVLFEGAQGTLLDIDHGTYPFVTSSNSTAGGACTGLGVGPTRIDGVLGIFKAYGTRVGEGPFPTEDKGPGGEAIRDRGREYGTVTGRPRRCGWFDAVAARYAVRVNGMDSVALTLLDVLDAFERINVCTAYKHEGGSLQQFPADVRILSTCEPVYRTFKGWRRDTSGCRSFDDLPPEAGDYVKALEDLIECDIDLVSVGPTAECSILREVSKLSAWLDPPAGKDSD